MKTTIVLEEALLKSAKQHALATQRTLTQLIQDALIRLIEEERNAALPRTVELPTFRGDGTYPGIDINSNASLQDHMKLSG
ncbi:MAG: hypothetical protein WBB01_05830 [Phormidesmis sp.]